MASGLSMPVGFKNSTDGNIQPAVDAVVVAATDHWFPGMTKQGVTAIFHTTGNPTCHVILRGGTRTGPNYEAAHIAQVGSMLEARGRRPVVMVDCSHGNSMKDPHRQPQVAAAVARQVAEGATSIIGVMLESHLVAGRQDLQPGVPARYGQSITDACVSFAETVPVLEELARAQEARRRVGLASRASVP
jgi:3-deoxy-7-phosphoheptulonate synthase